MGDLTLSEDRIRKIEKKDKLFGKHLRKSLDDFSVKWIRSVPGRAKAILDAMQPEDVYVARIPGEVRKGIASGDLEKVKNGLTDLWNGTVRSAEGNREFVKQANFEKVDYQGRDLANLHQLAMQAQLTEISEQLLSVEDKVDEVIEGQHSDRVAKVQAGVHSYETAVDYADDDKRDAQLTNALQTLNEGRTQLMVTVERALSKSPRDPGLVDKIWSLAGIDKPRVDLKRELRSEIDKVEESVAYIRIATAYLFRTHVLMGERKAAERSVRQFQNVASRVTRSLESQSIYLPESLMEGSREIEEVSRLLESETASDVVIEIPYNKLVSNGSGQDV